MQVGVGLSTVLPFYGTQLLFECYPFLLNSGAGDIQSELSTRPIALQLASAHPLPFFLVANLLTEFINISLHDLYRFVPSVPFGRLYYLNDFEKHMYIQR